MRFGVPVTEFDTVHLGFTVERTDLDIDLTIAPPRYLDFINQFGVKTDTFRANLGFARDTRDSITWPTRGWLNEVSVEVGLPPGDLTYYRATYQSQFFYTFDRWSWLTVMLNGELGYADGYDDKPLPFFKNFYAGGVGSVRGFETATLGPRDINGDVLGGDRRFIGNFELLFPMPGYKEKNVRLGVFTDVGNVWDNVDDVRPWELKSGVGLGLRYDTPVGPLRFDIGVGLDEDLGYASWDYYIVFGHPF
jgi:outer membrane protein insertion porin family